MKNIILWLALMATVQVLSANEALDSFKPKDMGDKISSTKTKQGISVNGVPLCPEMIVVSKSISVDEENGKEYYVETESSICKNSYNDTVFPDGKNRKVNITLETTITKKDKTNAR